MPFLLVCLLCPALFPPPLPLLSVRLSVCRYFCLPVCLFVFVVMFIYISLCVCFFVFLSVFVYVFFFFLSYCHYLFLHDLFISLSLFFLLLLFSWVVYFRPFVSFGGLFLRVFLSSFLPSFHRSKVIPNNIKVQIHISILVHCVVIPFPRNPFFKLYISFSFSFQALRSFHSISLTCILF